MATYASLTAAQQKVLADYDTAIRPVAGQLARVLTRMQAVNDQYNASASAVLAALTTTETVPNTTTLAGSQDLLQTELVNMTSYLQNILGTYNDAPHRQAYSKAVGAGNLTGNG
jgi:hypothetical protein